MTGVHCAEFNVARAVDVANGVFVAAVCAELLTVMDSSSPPWACHMASARSGLAGGGGVSIRGPVVRTALAGLVAVLTLAGAPGNAIAAQPPPSNPSDEDLKSERGAVESAAERVGVLTNQVAVAGAELTAAQLELAETYDNVTAARQQQRAARVVADAAQAVANDTRAQLDAASARIREAQRQVDEFTAASYRQGSAVGSVVAFLGSDSPRDLLARAELLDSVGASQLDALDAMRRGPGGQGEPGLDGTGSAGRGPGKAASGRGGEGGGRCRLQRRRQR